ENRDSLALRPIRLTRLIRLIRVTLSFDSLAMTLIWGHQPPRYLRPRDRDTTFRFLPSHIPMRTRSLIHPLSRLARSLPILATLAAALMLLPSNELLAQRGGGGGGGRGAGGSGDTSTRKLSAL